MRIGHGLLSIRLHNKTLRKRKDQQEFDWDLKSDLVQDYWNEFETQLVGVADEIVPYKLFEFKTVVEPITRTPNSELCG